MAGSTASEHIRSMAASEDVRSMAASEDVGSTAASEDMLDFATCAATFDTFYPDFLFIFWIRTHKFQSNSCFYNKGPHVKKDDPCVDIGFGNDELINSSIFVK